MGDRPQFIEVCAKAWFRPIRRCVGGSLEQHDTGGNQDTQIGHNGPEGLFGGGADHEEVAAQQIDPIVRGVHGGGAHLHYYRAHETWLVVGLFAR